MKKILFAVLLALVLALTLSFAIAAEETPVRDCTVEGHDFSRANCTTAKTCQYCGATEGEPRGHQWVEATCTDAAVCSICEATYGEARGHVLLPVTCTEGAKCTQCDYVEGAPTGHSYTNGCDVICNICNAARRVAAHADENADKVCDHCAASLVVGAMQGPEISHVSWVGTIAIIVGGALLGFIVGFAVWFFAFRKRILGKAGLL